MYFFALSAKSKFLSKDVLYRTQIEGMEDTTFHDQIFSLDWVQSLASKNSWIQPYVKLGIGQLDQDASGSYAGGLTPPAVYDSWTVVAGAGLRIFIVRSFALKAEGTTYLTGGNISTWQDNFAVSGGVSLYF